MLHRVATNIFYFVRGAPPPRTCRASLFRSARWLVAICYLGSIAAQAQQTSPSGVLQQPSRDTSAHQKLKGVDFRLPRGSVIAGTIVDEVGDPMPGVTVRVMRYQYLQGDRRLTPAGGGQTDDKGQFRVWGLMPGEYYVNGIVRNFNIGNFAGRGGPGGFGGPGGPGGFAGPGGPGGGRSGFGGRGGFGPPADDEEQLAYAPTYYPGVAAMAEAKPIIVGLSQEVLDINFGMQLVRAARISGRV